jgi:RNA polymerase sigma factor (sigma-70 family)
MGMALGSDSPWLALVRASTQDRRLVRREQVLEALYREFFPKVFNYVCYRVSNETVAQDITADVFEKAVRKLASLRSLDSAGPWLFRIAKNSITDYYRRVGSSRHTSLEELPGAVLPTRKSDSPEMQVIQQETFTRLQKHLRSLSNREQEIIALKFAAGLNNRQIAPIVGESAGNVGTILYRAMCKLREAMVDEEILDE